MHNRPLQVLYVTNQQTVQKPSLRSNLLLPKTWKALLLPLKEKNKPKQNTNPPTKKPLRHRRKWADTVSALVRASSREYERGLVWVFFAQSSTQTLLWCNLTFKSREIRGRLYFIKITCVTTKEKLRNLKKRNYVTVQIFSLTATSWVVYTINKFFHTYFCRVLITNQHWDNDLFLKKGFITWLSFPAKKIFSIRHMIMPWHKPAYTCTDQTYEKIWGVFVSRICGNMKVSEQRGYVPDFHGYLELKSFKGNVYATACSYLCVTFWRAGSTFITEPKLFLKQLTPMHGCSHLSFIELMSWSPCNSEDLVSETRDNK